MTIHGKFIGRLIRKPESAGPKKYGFTLMYLTLDDSDVANEAHALLDPKVLDKPETSKDSRKWDAGDLVRLEGEVVRIDKCKCCGNPLAVVDAFKCARITGTA